MTEQSQKGESLEINTGLRSEYSYQFGDKSHANIRDMSDKEWDKLMEHVDDFIDDFKDAVESEKKISEENKEQFQKTAKEIMETLKDKELANKLLADESLIDVNISLSKEQELALTGSTTAGMDKTGSTTECAESDDENHTWTITAFTEDGIICKQFKDGESTELWRMSYKHAGDYKKVTEFLERFDKHAELGFVSSKDFWENYLDGKISDEELKDIISKNEYVL